MTPSDAKTVELAELLALMCDGDLGRAESERLEALLLDDPAAQEFYHRYISLDVELAWRAADRRAEGENSNGILQNANCKLPAINSSCQSPPSAFPLPPSVSLSSFLPTTPLGNVAFSYAVSAVLVCLGLWIFSLMSGSSPKDAVVKYNPANSQNYTKPNQPAPAPEPKIVSIARITGMVDCRWVNADDAPFHDRVVQGTKYMLKSGLMEITYHTGAKVILQGPCTYEVESADGGYLSLGKLTARVETAKPQAAKQKSPLPLPPSALFAIRTPTATVTDLGTEFGVEVSEGGDSTVQVFVGEVISTATNSRGVKTESIHLKAGESVGIEKHGIMVRLQSDAFASATKFVRAIVMPVRPTLIPNFSVRVSASSYQSENRLPQYLIDSMGFDEAAQAVIATNPNRCFWNTENGVTKEDTWLMFDLGVPTPVGEMIVFNINDTIGGTARLRRFVTADIWYCVEEPTVSNPTDANPGNWTKLIDGQKFAEATYNECYNTPTRVALNVSARCVLMNNITNAGASEWGNSYGLSKVRFTKKNHSGAGKEAAKP